MNNNLEKIFIKTYFQRNFFEFFENMEILQKMGYKIKAIVFHDGDLNIDVYDKDGDILFSDCLHIEKEE